jgi:DNA modification methylase
MLTAFSDPGDLAFEPFCGSGTGIISAEVEGRRCCAVDLAPAYCDVAVRRWSKFTGRVAVLAGDGRTFDELSAAREVPA